jgi:hypothetical protein
MYTTITPAQRSAAEIEQLTIDTLSFIEARLIQLHKLATDSAVFEVFGTHAVGALGAYATLLDALSTVNPYHKAPAFDLRIYQPQDDGSVLYVAPEVAAEVTHSEDPAQFSG